MHVSLPAPADIGNAELSSPLQPAPSIGATEAIGAKEAPQPQQSSTPDDASSDCELLARFLERRDPEAFTAIVRRYERLVMGVALRQVGDRQAAEDVFQATFLVLAERAARIRNPASLPSWLHGTTRRIGLAALSQSRREKVMTRLPDEPSTNPTALQQMQTDFERQTLDDELAKLPERFRLPLVLHYLEGLTGREVAERLQVSVDAVEGRLKQGRARLRERLARHGIGFGVLLAAFQSSQQSASASSTLLESTAAASVAWVSHHSLEGCSANAARLAGKELATMTLFKSTTLLCCGGVLLLGAGVIGSLALAGGTGGSPQSSPVIATDSRSGGAGARELVVEPQDVSIETNARIDVVESMGESPQAGPHSYQTRSKTRERIETALEAPAALDPNLLLTLEDASQHLSVALGVPVQLDRERIEELGIDPTERNLQFVAQGHSTRDALEVFLREVAGDNLDYVVRNGVLYVTTRDFADAHMETVLYELRDLGDSVNSQTVLDVLQQGTSGEWLDIDGAGGEATVVSGAVMVRQTQRVHREIAGLLEQLRQFASRDDLPKVNWPNAARNGLDGLGGKGPGEGNPGGALGGGRF